jgi:hypothetical protein
METALEIGRADCFVPYNDEVFKKRHQSKKKATIWDTSTNP